MRRLAMVLAGLALAVFAFAVAAQEPVKIEERPLTRAQAAISDPAELYISLCAACHGTDGKGAGPAAPALRDPVPDLTLLAQANGGVFPAEEVERSINGERRVVAHGSAEMPVWGDVFEEFRPDHKPVQRMAFTRDRIGKLVEHLASLQAQ